MIKIQALELEFVGARKESYRSDSRKPIVEDGTLQDDQNEEILQSMPWPYSSTKSNMEELLDPFNGMEDLQNKIIRTPLDQNTYSDDPLRMMRAVRFATKLEFFIEDNSPSNQR